MGSHRSTPVHMDMLYSIAVSIPIHYMWVRGTVGVHRGYFPLWKGKGGIGNVRSLLKAKAGSHLISLLSSSHQLWHHPSEKIKLSKSKTQIIKERCQFPCIVSVSKLSFTIMYSRMAPQTTKPPFAALSGSLLNPQWFVCWYTTYSLYNNIYGTSGAGDVDCSIVQYSAIHVHSAHQEYCIIYQYCIVVIIVHMYINSLS